MPGKYFCNFMLTDFIPACTSDHIFTIHKGWMQISGEREAFIQEQCHAIVTVTWRVEDLPVQAKAGKKGSAVFHFQRQVIILCDRHIREVLPGKKLSKRGDEINLTFQHDQL